MSYSGLPPSRRNMVPPSHYGHGGPPPRHVRSSQERRLSEARKMFLDDETAKPILRSPYEESNPESKALYYGTLKNRPFNDIATPDQAEFLAHQEELDRHERQLWGGGLKHRIAPSSFWAGDWLRNNAFTYPRVQRHGRRLRLQPLNADPPSKLCRLRSSPLECVLRRELAQAGARERCDTPSVTREIASE